MAGSLITSVRRAITEGFRTHLSALPAFNASAGEGEVVVEYAYTFEAPSAQRVYTGRAQADTPPAALRAGRNHRNETGTFEVNILVQLAGSSPEEADLRVDAIGTQFEEWVADRKSNELGIGLTSLYVVSWIGDYFGVDGGSGAIRTYTVRWNARLT